MAKYNFGACVPYKTEGVWQFLDENMNWKFFLGHEPNYGIYCLNGHCGEDVTQEILEKHPAQIEKFERDNAERFLGRIKEYQDMEKKKNGN